MSDSSRFMRDYLASRRAFIQDMRDGKLLPKLKRGCHHVYSYGMWSSRWLCNKCEGYYTKQGTPRRTS